MKRMNLGFESHQAVIFLAVLVAGGVFCLDLSAQSVKVARPVLGSQGENQNYQPLQSAITDQGTFQAPTLLERDQQFVLQFCDACRRAAGDYREEDRTAAVDEARRLLKTNVKELYFLLSHNADRKNAEGWIRYLRLQELQRMLISETDDFDLLSTAYDKFTRPEANLDLPHFFQTRDALRDYLNIHDVPNHLEERRELFSSTVDDVCRDISQLLSNNDPELAEYFNNSMAYLLDQQPKSRHLLEAKALLDKRFSTPNIQVDISDKLFTAGGSIKIHEPTQINEIIRGTSTRGNGMVDGVAVPVLVENAKLAEINLLFDATLVSNSVGVNQGVTVYSASTGRLKANKPIYIGSSLMTAPTRVSGAMDAVITGLNSGRGPIGTQVVQQRVSEEFPYSKAESQRRMEIRFAERIDGQVDSVIREKTKLADTIKQINQIIPTTVSSSSTTDRVHLQAKVAFDDQVGPISAPPQSPEGDLTVKFHESAINNATFRTLAGVEFTETEFLRWLEARFPGLASSLPKPEEISNDEELTLTFSDDAPILLRFNGDTISVAINIDAVSLGDKRFPAMDIDVVYAAEKRGSECFLVKKEVEVWPAGLDRQAIVPARLQAVRSQVLRRLQENLEDEILLKAIDVPSLSAKEGETALSGTLVPANITFQSGWALCAMEFVPLAKENAEGK